jgi:ketosteroid isomerase-like protein
MRPASLLAALFLLPYASAMSSHPPLAESDVRDFMSRYEAALGSEDFDQVAPLIHPDALYRFNDGDFKGHEAIRGAFEKTWALEIEDVTYEMRDIDVVSLTTESATVAFTFHWSGKGPNGRFEATGRGTLVIVRLENDLVVVLEHLGPSVP